MPEENEPGTDPANPGASGPVFTQEQVNAMNANTRRSAVEKFFKDNGLEPPKSGDDLKAAMSAALEYSKLKDGEKGDVERISGERDTYKAQADEVPTLKTQLLRQQVAGTSKLPVRLWKFVEGDDEDSIKESIKGLKEELGLADDDGDDGDDQGSTQQRTPRGTGRPAPNPQQGGGSGKPPKPSMSAGREAYEAKYAKK